MSKKQDHWLARPENLKWLWSIFVAILAATVIAELFIERHGYFGLDQLFAFNAWFGFLACVALVAFAKVLGTLLKRSDTYYDSELP